VAPCFLKKGLTFGAGDRSWEKATAHLAKILLLEVFRDSCWTTLRLLVSAGA
jgi:hypothetical protein